MCTETSITENSFSTNGALLLNGNNYENVACALDFLSATATTEPLSDRAAIGLSFIQTLLSVVLRQASCL